MALAKVLSRAAVGISAPPVIVEVHLSRGLPSFSIVGLPETAVKESKDRVRSALLNSQFDFPPRRITVNLAPADLPKEARATISPLRWVFCAPQGRSNKARSTTTKSSANWGLMVAYVAAMVSHPLCWPPARPGID